MATWSGDGKSLTIRYTSEFDRQGETMTTNRTEVWTLDEAGKVLTIQYTSSFPRGESTATLVYDQQ